MPPVELGGHTRIKNEVLEDLALAGPILGIHDWPIIVLVIRDSWGWDGGATNWTHTAWWPAKFAEYTGFHRESLSRALSNLIRDNVLLTREEADGTHLAVNEHTKTWTGAHRVAMDHLDRDKLSRDKSSRKKTAVQWRDKLSRDESSQGGVINHHGGRDESSHLTGSKVNNGAGSDDPKERSKEKDLKDAAAIGGGAEVVVDQDPDFAKVEKVFFEVTGRLPGAVDMLEITQALTQADAETICRVVRRVAGEFKPRYDGHCIRAFAYFKPAILEEIAGGRSKGGKRSGTSKTPRRSSRASLGGSSIQGHHQQARDQM